MVFKELECRRDVTYCKLERKEQLRLIDYFVTGEPARPASELVEDYRNSDIRLPHKLREKIVLKQQNRSEEFFGNIELDESYFGGVRKSKRGRGAAGKILVFGILKLVEKVYTQVIGDTKTSTVRTIICQKIRFDSIIYTDYYWL